MADVSIFDPVRMPSDWLIALDWRAYHFAIQPYHYIIRALHVLSMSAFYGGIGLLDIRLMGLRGSIALKPFTDHILPWLYATFLMAAVSGMALFIYDPVHIGSRAYWTPKLIAITLGLLNAYFFHRAGYVKALATSDDISPTAKFAGFLSLIFWTAAVVFSCLNVEAMPKVLLS